MSLEDANSLGIQIVRELCNQGIISSEPQTHELHGIGARYAVGPNIGDHTVGVHHEVVPCGLDVEVGRKVFDAGEVGFGLVCPECSESIDSDSIDWLSAVSTWAEAEQTSNFRCPQCEHESSFSNWFQPKWGFGNLAFQFHQCSLKKECVDLIADLLKHEVTWVKTIY